MVHFFRFIISSLHQAPLEVTAVTAGDVEMTSPPDFPIKGATAEIPFVPASLRQTAKPEVIDDSIVVVGQRQKKRKRAKKLKAPTTAMGTPKSRLLSRRRPRRKRKIWCRSTLRAHRISWTTGSAASKRTGGPGRGSARRGKPNLVRVDFFSHLPRVFPLEL